MELITSEKKLNELAAKADEYILNKNNEQLSELVEELIAEDNKFEDKYCNAYYFYIIANCYAALYQRKDRDWYSDELMKSVLYYRKALYEFDIAKKKIDYFDRYESYKELESNILTNLANQLSSQGRALCCISLYDRAIELNGKTEALIAKARNQLYLANSLYDDGHRYYHHYIAYNLILEASVDIDKLYPEQRIDIEENGNLYNFKNWFESNFDKSSFNYFKKYKHDFSSKKEQQYLKWCGENKLFINDLNDICNHEIVYTDILTLPPFRQKINELLSLREELVYHGNFDEIKSDYCYARYLIFTAQNIPEDTPHFFNSTYPHVDDFSYSIDNLKTAHYKSAFRILYSLFDKIAYFLSRFLNLNGNNDDRNISFNNLFKHINNESSSKTQKPNEKIKDSNNPYIHALFYILKDFRDTNGSESIAKWIDPDAEAFTEIRNRLEHRSLKIVDDMGYDLALQGGYSQLTDDIRKIEEKNKLSSHSLLIPISQFESRLITLIKLVRNSIIYLPLLIEFEERGALEDEGELILSRVVPLKKS